MKTLNFPLKASGSVSYLNTFTVDPIDTSINDAIADASAGDLVIVNAGLNDGQIVLKAGVDLWFKKGCECRYYLDTESLFKLPEGVSTNDIGIFGYGVFKSYNAPVLLWDASEVTIPKVTIECDHIGLVTDFENLDGNGSWNDNQKVIDCIGACTILVVNCPLIDTDVATNSVTNLVNLDGGTMSFVSSYIECVVGNHTDDFDCNYKFSMVSDDVGASAVLNQLRGISTSVSVVGDLMNNCTIGKLFQDGSYDSLFIKYCNISKVYGTYVELVNSSITDGTTLTTCVYSGNCYISTPPTTCDYIANPGTQACMSLGSHMTGERESVVMTTNIALHNGLGRSDLISDATNRTITLPATNDKLIPGMKIKVYKLQGTNTLTFSRNGNKINGASADITILAITLGIFTLVFINATDGYLLTRESVTLA